MLGAVAGTDPDAPPLTACYLTNDPATQVWLAVSDGDSATAPSCALTFSGSNWTIRLTNGFEDWWVAFVVVY